jgi:transposase
MDEPRGRYDVSDAHWNLIAGLFPRQGRGGQWKCHRTVLNGMLWVLRSGAPWRDLPGRYGKVKTVYDRFNRYRRDGTLDRILKALRIRLDKHGKIDWDLWLVDGSNVRASRSAAGARKKTGSTATTAAAAATNPKTTRWAAAAADGGASSTWSLTETAFPWRSRSPRARRTSRRNSNP